MSNYCQLPASIGSWRGDLPEHHFVFKLNKILISCSVWCQWTCLWTVMEQWCSTPRCSPWSGLHSGSRQTVTHIWHTLTQCCTVTLRHTRWYCEVRQGRHSLVYMHNMGIKWITILPRTACFSKTSGTPDCSVKCTDNILSHKHKYRHVLRYHTYLCCSCASR